VCSGVTWVPMGLGGKGGRAGGGEGARDFGVGAIKKRKSGRSSFHVCGSSVP